MALNEQSSVVSSIQQLVQAENERVFAEHAARESALAREREQRHKAQHRERELAEKQAVLERDTQHREATARESEQARQQLIAQANLAFERARQELDREYRAKSLRYSEQLASLSGRHRILMAALVTLVVGAGLCWLLLIVPGQRQAKVDYASLNGLYEGSLQERENLVESFGRERRQLVQQLDALLKRGVPVTSGTTPQSHPAPAPPRVPVFLNSKPKPSCVCQTGDPLCDCLSP